MTRRSRAASRLCQKSNMGFLYQQRARLAWDGLLEWWAQSGSGTVMRRLLKRFSKWVGMGAGVADGGLMMVTAGPGYGGMSIACVYQTRSSQSQSQGDVRQAGTCGRQSNEWQAGRWHSSTDVANGPWAWLYGLWHNRERVVSAKSTARKSSGALSTAAARTGTRTVGDDQVRVAGLGDGGGGAGRAATA